MLSILKQERYFYEKVVGLVGELLLDFGMLELQKYGGRSDMGSDET